VALFVPDLRAAEEYYVRVLGLTVIMRETPLEVEPTRATWATLPPGSGWADADAAGVALEMVALQRDDILIVLFARTTSGGQIHVIGVVIDDAAIEEIAGQLPADRPTAHRPGYLEFVDPYGIRWQLSSGARFRSSGEVFGRWIDLRTNTERGETDSPAAVPDGA